MPKATQRVTILVNDPRWKGKTVWVRTAAKAAFKTGEMTIALANDAEVRGLNAQFRGKDRPTNVLSFPDGEGGFLGDIILAYETIADEAEAQNKPLKHHIMHLVMHGVLHLQGYDHEKASDAKRMEDKEVMLLSAMGIANPYESR